MSNTEDTRTDAEAAREAAAAAGAQPGEEVGEEATPGATAAPDGKAKPDATAAPKDDTGGEPKGGDEVDPEVAAIDAAPDAEQTKWADETYGPVVSKVMGEAGVNAHAANEYFQKHGTLPDATFAKLTEAGYPKEMVSAYIKGVNASATEATAEANRAVEEQEANAQKYAFDVVGGKEVYDSMTAWARSGLTKDEAADFNKAIGSNDPAQMRLAAQSLKARYEAANGKLPARDLKSAAASSRPAARGNDQGGDEVFRSTAEMIAAQQDPRYGRDPAYTRDVEQKVVRSNLFGHARKA